MKTESSLQIELSVGPRSENQTGFRAGQKLAGRAGIGRVHRRRVSQAGDDKFLVVAAQGRDRAEFVRPLDFIFHISTAYHVRKAIPLPDRGQRGAGAWKSGRGTTIHTDTDSGCVGFADGVVERNAGCGIIGFDRAPATFRPVKSVVDPIVAELQAEGVGHLAAKTCAEDRAVCVKPTYPTPILLFELVASVVVYQVVSKIGK